MVRWFIGERPGRFELFGIVLTLPIASATLVLTMWSLISKFIGILLNLLISEMESSGINFLSNLNLSHILHILSTAFDRVLVQAFAPFFFSVAYLYYLLRVTLRSSLFSRFDPAVTVASSPNESHILRRWRNPGEVYDLIESPTLSGLSLLIGSSLMLFSQIFAHGRQPHILIGLGYTVGLIGLGRLRDVAANPAARVESHLTKVIQRALSNLDVDKYVIVVSDDWLGVDVLNWLIDSGWIAGERSEGLPALFPDIQPRLGGGSGSPEALFLSLERVTTRLLLVWDDLYEDLPSGSHLVRLVFRKELPGYGLVGLVRVRGFRSARVVLVPVISGIDELDKLESKVPISRSRLIVSAASSPEAYLSSLNVASATSMVIRVPDPVEFAQERIGGTTFYPERSIGSFSLAMHLSMLPSPWLYGEAASKTFIVLIGGGKELYYWIERVAYGAVRRSQHGPRNSPLVIWLNDNDFFSQIAPRHSLESDLVWQLLREGVGLPGSAEALRRVHSYLSEYFGSGRVYLSHFTIGRVARPAAEEPSGTMEYPYLAVIGDPSSFDDIRGVLRVLSRPHTQDEEEPRAGGVLQDGAERIIVIVAGRTPDELFDSMQETFFAIDELEHASHSRSVTFVPIVLVPFYYPETLKHTASILNLMEADRRVEMGAAQGGGAWAFAFPSPGDYKVHAAQDVFAEAISSIGAYMRPPVSRVRNGEESIVVRVSACIPDYPGSLRDFIGEFACLDSRGQTEGPGYILDLHDLSIRVCPAHPDRRILALVGSATIRKVDGGIEDLLDEEEAGAHGAYNKFSVSIFTEAVGKRSAEIDDQALFSFLTDRNGRWRMNRGNVCPRGAQCKIHCARSWSRIAEEAFNIEKEVSNPFVNDGGAPDAEFSANIFVCFQDWGPGTIYRVLSFLTNPSGSVRSAKSWLDITYIRALTSKSRDMGLVELTGRMLVNNNRVQMMENKAPIGNIINSIVVKVPTISGVDTLRDWEHWARSVKNGLGDEWTTYSPPRQWRQEGDGAAARGGGIVVIRRSVFSCDSEVCAVSNRAPVYLVDHTATVQPRLLRYILRREFGPAIERLVHEADPSSFLSRASEVWKAEFEQARRMGVWPTLIAIREFLNPDDSLLEMFIEAGRLILKRKLPNTRKIVDVFQNMARERNEGVVTARNGWTDEDGILEVSFRELIRDEVNELEPTVRFGYVEETRETLANSTDRALKRLFSEIEESTRRAFHFAILNQDDLLQSFSFWRLPEYLMILLHFNPRVLREARAALMAFSLIQNNVLAEVLKLALFTPYTTEISVDTGPAYRTLNLLDYAYY